MSEPQVVFARHIIDVPDSDVEQLFGNGRIGVDYGMGAILNEQKFREEGKNASAAKTMDSLRTDGGIVLAKYLYDDIRLLGFVNERKNVEVIEAENGVKLKTIQLDQYEQIHRDDHPELFDIGTARDAVQNLHKDADVVRESFNSVFGNVRF